MSTEKDERIANLKTRISNIPEVPGVYKWMDAKGTIVYIGKAKNLKKRMLSYVQEGVKRSPWITMLVENINDFDTTIVETELEALILETNLIKEHKPKYNIVMKDDKQYVYIRISKEEFSSISVVRSMENDEAEYIGPKTSAESVRKTLAFLRGIFPFRTCNMGIHVNNNNKVKTPYRASDTSIPIDIICIKRDRPTPCIDHHIAQCLAPCIGKVTREEYEEKAIRGVREFFKGEYDAVETIIQEKMKQCVIEKKFERAAVLRDHLKDIEHIKGKQIVSDTSREDADIIAVAMMRNKASIIVLKERNGRVIEEQHFLLQGEAETEEEALTQFLPQYIECISDVSPLLILSHDIEEKEMMKIFAEKRANRAVHIHVPERGKKSKLISLALKNAQWKLVQSEAKWEAEARKVEEALRELQQLLQRKEIPKRIEGYDISHSSGEATVGSMVVFLNGKPKKEHYRSLDIRTLSQGEIDDYASLKEVTRRRLQYIAPSPFLSEKYWMEQGAEYKKCTKKDVLFICTTLEKNGIQKTKEDIAVKEYLIIKKHDITEGWIHKKSVNDRLIITYRPEAIEPHYILMMATNMTKKMKEKKAYILIQKNDEILFQEHGWQTIDEKPKDADEAKTDEVWMMCEKWKKKDDISFSSIPDVLLIDGGKGQVESVHSVLKELNINIPLLGLAKREEEIFIPGVQESIQLGNTSELRHLLERIRNEAHRFSNDRRKRKLEKKLTHSLLDEVESIGEKTKQKLLKKFGNTDEMLNASNDELREILTKTQIENLRQQFPSI